MKAPMDIIRILGGWLRDMYTQKLKDIILMEIPLIETEFNNLKGIGFTDSDKLKVQGNLFLEDNIPKFKGKSNFGKYGSNNIPDFSFEFIDKKDRKITCTKVSPICINSVGEFEAKILKVLIEKGSINNDDEVFIYDIIKTINLIYKY